MEAKSVPTKQKMIMLLQKNDFVSHAKQGVGGRIVEA